MRQIADIIKAAGGPRAVMEASSGSLTRDAVYKWQSIGIPDRHWPLLMGLTETTPQELFEANKLARAGEAA